MLAAITLKRKVSPLKLASRKTLLQNGNNFSTNFVTKFKPCRRNATRPFQANQYLHFDGLPSYKTIRKGMYIFGFTLALAIRGKGGVDAEVKQSAMDTSWLGACMVKLIKWKYGNAVQIQDLQNLEYDPGGSLCKCFRSLTTYSNTVILIAFSFAVVTASGQYVNNGISSPYSNNSSKLQPSLGTSVFVDKNYALDVSTIQISHLAVSPPIPLKVSTGSAFSGFSKISTINFNQNKNHISNDSVVDDNSLLVSDSLNSTDVVAEDEFEFGSTVSAIILSMNDSQIPRYSNRTPHYIENDAEETEYFGVLSVILGLMILLTIVGNVFVIAAILIEKNLQNVANYLIVSLAVADLMVACLVMPLGAVYEISDGWVLGPELCDMWTASDVLCCTASILHLVAIALDRYWAVTDVEYVTRRSAWRIVVMIIIIWTVALIVSVAPQFGWKDPGYLDRINLDKRCLVSQDIGYQIFATCATFYVPLLAILILYWKIFQAARRRIHKRALRNPAYGLNSNKNSNVARKRFNFFKKTPQIKCDLETGTCTNIALMDIPSSCSAAESSQENAAGGRNTDYHDFNTDRISVDKTLNSNCANADIGPSTSKVLIETSMSTLITKQIQKVKSKRDKKQSIEAKREKKAAKTLAIITGAFVICWLPFFVMALVMPMCPACHINRYVSSFFLWLGYFNSTLNPIIYTIFSPEFRQAFNRILCGIHNSGIRNR